MPFSKSTQKIAAFGNATYEIIVGGTGSGNVNRAYSISLAEGMKNGGFKVDESLSDAYVAYIKKAKESQPKGGFFGMMGLGSNPVAEMPVDPDLAGKLAETSDIAIITIGRNAGEGADRKADGDFTLTDTEKSNLKNISQAFQSKGKKTVVVLNIGGVIETASWKEIPDAILLVWNPDRKQETLSLMCYAVKSILQENSQLHSLLTIQMYPLLKTSPELNLNLRRIRKMKDQAVALADPNQLRWFMRKVSTLDTGITILLELKPPMNSDLVYHTPTLQSVT